MGDEIARGTRNEYLIHCYVEVCKSVEERVQKMLLWKNAKPSLPGSPCHCRCHGIAAHGVAAAAVAAVSLPSARHIGAARSNSNTPPLLVLRTKTEIHQIKNNPIKSSSTSLKPLQ